MGASRSGRTGDRPARAAGDSAPVSAEEREGVFVHAFKCLQCRLEFQLYSWLRDRHKVGEVFCPECGERTPMLHWRTCVNESRVAGSREDSDWEIYKLNVRFPDFILMPDSSLG